MRNKTTRLIRLPAAAILCLTFACDSLDLGNIAGLFGPSVLIVIENNTSFTAVPDIRTSESSNFWEDGFEDEDQITGFGNNGVLQANQSASIRLACDGDLELIIFGGATFQEGNGFPLGDVGGDEKLRRDREFDCGDTIRIRLSGTIFNFRADVDVEHTDDSGDVESFDDVNDDNVADFLEDLFD